jgi:phage terminase small subunit
MPNRIKPRALKVLEGTLQKHRDNPNEPIYEPTSGMETPHTLRDAEAVRVFNEVREILESKFVLTRADALALAQLANQESMINELWMSGDKPTAAEITQLRMLYVEFGLTPASRPKVSAAGEKKETNPFAELLG